MDCPTEIWTQIYVDIRDFTPCDHWVVPAYDGTCSVQNCYNWPKDGARRIISMMKTCKFLWDIGEPLLFRDVYNRRARHGQFVETIQKRPDVGKLVRTYEYASLAAIDGVPPIIHHLPNLKSLTLFHVTITKDIVDGLLAATQLEYLSISAMVRVPSPICQWSSAIPEDWSGGRFGQRLQTLRVRDFSANYGTKPGWLQLFSSNIKTLDLANLSETLEPIVTALRNGSVAFLNVTTLKIARSVFAPTDALKSASLVSEVISFCPELHNLWVESLNEVDCASVMPQLSYFGWLPLSSHNAVPSLRLAANLVSLQIGDTSVGYLSEIVMPNIKYLHAFSLRGAFIANLGLIAKCFPNVELLLLQGTQEPLLSTKNISIHIGKLRRLRQLWLRRLQYISTSRRADIASQVPSMVDLLEKGQLSPELDGEQHALAHLRQYYCSQLELVRASQGYAWVFNAAENAWWPCRRSLLNEEYWGTSPMLPDDWIA